MTSNEILQFSWRILRAKPWRSILVALALLFTSLLTTVFFSFTEGLKKNILQPIETKLSSEVLIVAPSTPPLPAGLNLLQYLKTQNSQGISPQVQAEITNFPEVLALAPETRIPFPVATRAEVVFGIPLDFDVTVSGFSETAVQPFLSGEQSFRGDETVLPVLLSPLLIEIYNSTLAEIVPGATRKTLTDFIGREIEFTFGKSNYLQVFANFSPAEPQVRRARIVGFAPFLPPFTLAIPEKVANEVIHTYSNTPHATVFPHSLLITPRSPSVVENLKQKLQDLKLNVRDLSENLDTLRTVFFTLQIVLFTAAGSALFFACLFFLTVLSLSAEEQRQNIGIMRAIGASRAQVRKIILCSGGMLGIIPILLGFFIAVIAASGLNVWLAPKIPVTIFGFSQIFAVDGALFCWGIPLVLLLPLMSSIFVAERATRISPLRALKQ